MSRPDALARASGREWGGPYPEPTPVPLRVVAERLSAEEAHAAERADARQEGPRPVLTAVGNALPPISPVAAVPGTVAPSGGALTPVSAPGLPMPFELPPRRSWLAEMLALIIGGQRTGRHRVEAVNRQAWSMFAPERRTRRRRRFRTRS